MATYFEVGQKNPRSVPAYFVKDNRRQFHSKSFRGRLKTRYVATGFVARKKLIRRMQNSFRGPGAALVVKSMEKGN